MAIDRKVFFSKVKAALFNGKLNDGQVRGMDATLDEWEARKLTDNRWLAYMFATAYHEVGKRMMPVREGFATTDEGARKVVAKRKYGVVVNGQVYYGRGLVQLTWDYNYKKLGDLLKIDLYKNPDLALDPRTSSAIMFEGMIRGSFTGKKLATYFNATTTDWNNARRIINGVDKASTIAAHAKKFHAAIDAATGAAAVA